MSEVVTWSRKAGVLTITVDRPQARNAMSAEVWRLIMRALDEAESEPEIRALIVTGAGGNFVAGADIKEFVALDGPQAEARSRAIAGHYDRIRRSPKPSVAAIDGWCLGAGFELALACDVRIAADRAKLGYPEIKLGIFPGTGGTVLLQKLIGAAAAREFALLGEPIAATRAHALGIVSQIVPAAELAAAAEGVAAKFAALSPFALAQAKSVLDAMLDADMAAAREREYAAYRACFESIDRVEGVAAFIEKRKARFVGR
jgi:enoyl-CoA hydratase/carnithine racemase